MDISFIKEDKPSQNCLCELRTKTLPFTLPRHQGLVSATFYFGIPKMVYTTTSWYYRWGLQIVRLDADKKVTASLTIPSGEYLKQGLWTLNSKKIYPDDDTVVDNMIYILNINRDKTTLPIPFNIGNIEELNTFDLVWVNNETDEKIPVTRSSILFNSVIYFK